MPSWQSRRVYVGGLYQPLIHQIRNTGAGVQVFEEPSGWERVDRGVYEIRRRVEHAENQEQFQTVGLLCREVLISLAQVVYDPQRHPTDDGVRPSETDAKRMLDAYVAVELEGGANEGARRHTKAALALANDLQRFQRTRISLNSKVAVKRPHISGKSCVRLILGCWNRHSVNRMIFVSAHGRPVCLSVAETQD